MAVRAASCWAATGALPCCVVPSGIPLHSSGCSPLLACRDVVAEPQQYPSFSRQDFPATRAAAHQAWQLAEAALKREPDSEVPWGLWPLLLYSGVPIQQCHMAAAAPARTHCGTSVPCGHIVELST